MNSFMTQTQLNDAFTLAGRLAGGRPKFRTTETNGIQDTADFVLTENDREDEVAAGYAIDDTIRNSEVWDGILTQKQMAEYRSDRFTDVRDLLITYFKRPDNTIDIAAIRNATTVNDVKGLSDISQIDTDMAITLLRDIITYFNISYIQSDTKNKLKKHVAEEVRKRKIQYLKWDDNHTKRT